jgi:protein SCO1
LIIVSALLLLSVAGGASAHAGITQAVLDDAAVEPRPDAALPLGLRFLDESAQPRTLSDLLAGKPAILVFADYSCRKLCTVLTFVQAGLGRSGLAAGADYGLIVIGLDPKDDPESARVMKATRIGSGTLLVLLTGEQAAIRAATAARGYGYAYDAEHDQFAHPATAFAMPSFRGAVTEDELVKLIAYLKSLSTSSGQQGAQQ